MPKRLAIIGAGSAGLISLDNVLRHLPDWEVRVFQKGGDVRGSWGNPYPGFISTSTKYTTQFSAFRKFPCPARGGGERNYEEFFREGEYGDYLEEFAADRDLLRHISLGTEVVEVSRSGGRWRVKFRNSERVAEELFDAVVVATGLAERPRPVDLGIPSVGSVAEREAIRGRTVVVMGGGESAADTANRLAAPERNNTVYLSLRSGIRVSPRYHPIRGVPSDFLRNRLLLSIDPDWRNRIGQKFVEARIRHREWFERLFPGRQRRLAAKDPCEARRRDWDLRLTRTSKDLLFNAFHNKSDGFLDAVGEERIRIIGPPVEGRSGEFLRFGGEGTLAIEADCLVPQLGFSNGLSEMFGGRVRLEEFYLGCQHVAHDDLFLIGFARPIIGNIPTISEQQAKYVTAVLAGKVPRPADIAELQAADRAYLAGRFSRIDIDTIHPVEMFPYCDRLAALTGTLPTRRRLGLKRWLKLQLAPATTLHYLDEHFDPAAIDDTSVHTPGVLNGLLALIRAADAASGGARRRRASGRG